MKTSSAVRGHRIGRSFYRRATLRIAFASIVTLSTIAQEEALEQVTLSPFTVDAKDGEGYRATDTLAGSRVRSNLRDLGASIAVVTQEFMNDIGATDGESLLSYVGNVEVGGMQGNFSDADLFTSDTNDSRINPQSSQRVRGLESATLTRDYFHTNIGFDSYNTSRVTVNRGPNSILFGLGTSGGVINNTLNRAHIGSNQGEVALRLDHRGGQRGILDYNKTVIADRLAIRVSALNERIEFKQEPAFEKDERFFLAWDLTLSKNEGVSWLGRTSTRGSFETGEIRRNPPDVVPPRDGYSSWFEGIGGQETLNQYLRTPGSSLSFIDNGALKREWVLNAINEGLVEVPEGATAEQFAAVEGQFVPKTEYNRITREGLNNATDSAPYFIWPSVNFNGVASGPGWQSSELSGVQGIMARWRPNGFPTQDLRWSNDVTQGPGYNVGSLQNRDVFDYHNLLFQGSTNEVFTDFDAKQLFFEQEFWNGNGGVELAWDRQSRDQQSLTGFSTGPNKAIRIDVTSHHAPADSDLDGVPDRTPNENVGRPVADFGDTFTTTGRDEQETFRATVFGTVNTRDFLEGIMGEILGSHTFTGLYEDRTNDASSRRTRGVWWADQGDFPGAPSISFGDNDNLRRQVNAQVYLGPDTRGLNSPDDVRVDGYIDVRIPQIGDTYGIWYWDDAANTGVINEWRIIEGLQTADLDRTTLQAKAISVQSKLFWDHIVGLYAIRKDKQDTWRRLQEDGLRGPTGSMALRLSDPGDNPTDGNFNEALLFLEDNPFDSVEGDTSTWSIVGYYPEEWFGELPAGVDLSAHLYQADSIQPIGGQVNILNEPLASPFGDTREWGVTLSLLENRLSLRFNRFKTSRVNARTDLDGALPFILGNANTGLFSVISRLAQAEEDGLSLFPSEADALLTFGSVPNNLDRTTGTDADLIGVNSYDEYYQRLVELLPTRIQEVYEPRITRNENGSIDFFTNPLDGSLQSTRDFVAEGIEIDMVGRITDRWSLSLNVAQQETVSTNTGPLAIPVMEEILQRSKDLQLYDTRTYPNFGSSLALGLNMESVMRGLRLEKALEGAKSQEQREWRINLVTRYDFRDGPMKGFGVGASLRYQSAVTAGYPNKFDEDGEAIADVTMPFLGPDDLNGDLFIRYRRPLNSKIVWNIQFNARNLYRKNGDDDIPAGYNPDGQLAVIRIPNEKQFFLSNSFTF